MVGLSLSSRERLIRAFHGEDVNRVPISLYEFDGFYDSWIYDYPEYVEILSMPGRRLIRCISGIHRMVDPSSFMRSSIRMT